jgi:hypothetical protein
VLRQLGLLGPGVGAEAARALCDPASLVVQRASARKGEGR